MYNKLIVNKPYEQVINIILLLFFLNNSIIWIKVMKVIKAVAWKQGEEE